MAGEAGQCKQWLAVEADIVPFFWLMSFGNGGNKDYVKCAVQKQPGLCFPQLLLSVGSATSKETELFGHHLVADIACQADLHW